MPTRREIIARIETPLTALYGEREARQIARIVVMELGGLCLTDLVAEPDKELGIDELDRIIGELTAGRPLQYVLGHTEFYGLDFQVREGREGGSVQGRRRACQFDRDPPAAG